MVILAVVMLLMFSAVFAWAKLPMDGIEAAISWLSGHIEASLPEGPLRSLLVDGILGGIGAVVIFLPQIFILFLILTSLEECGYLARAAYLMDRLMVRVGLSGKSFIPLLSSFACAIPAVMATRVIENRRDRLTTILIAPLMSCSARLPVYTLMIAAFIPDRQFVGGLIGLQGLVLFSMYALGIVIGAAVALLLKRTLLRGATPPFLMEMPVYKWPSPRVVLHRMFDRGWDFLHNAGTIIFAVSIVMWGALYYPRISPGELAPLTAARDRLERERDDARAAGDAAREEAASAGLADVANRMEGAQKRQSLLGRVGRLIEPAVKPLGWDWRIGSGVIASFPRAKSWSRRWGSSSTSARRWTSRKVLNGWALRSSRPPGPTRAARSSTSPSPCRSWSFSPSVPSASRPWPSSAARPEPGPGRPSRSVT